jgi:RNA polymerase sigma factor (sigma-70 family)
MSEDAELLRRYCVEHSEAAFTELVRRHVDLIYSAALRLMNGDAHRAQDVTQQVFIEFARQARRLIGHPAPAGWLYTTTRLVALRTIRTEQRRRAHEHEATTMNELLRIPTPEPDWVLLRPVLEDAMHELGEKDRHAVLLRFFQNKSLKEVGMALGLGENAARMRVERALEKLRAKLVRRGITTTATVLSTVISVNAVQVAPAGLAATLSGTSLASAAGTGTTLTFLKAIIMTKSQAGIIGAIVVAGVLTPLVIEHQAQVRLREENQSLHQQVAQLEADNKNLSSRIIQVKSALAPRLPAPPMQANNPPSALSTEDLQPTNANLYARFKDSQPKLTAEQAEDYLKENGRKASSLLAAYRTSGDPKLLKEAMEKYPDDPQVAFEAAFANDSSPEQQRQWLDTFEKSAPDNALANYLSADNYFKAGQTDQAVQELTAAAGKQQFQDYTLDRVQNDVEAYLSAGYPVAEAEYLSTWQLALPQLAPEKQLGQDLIDLANAYKQSGDQASAQTALQMAVNLGQRYSPTAAGEAIIDQLVGLAIQRGALSAMDPNSPYGDSGQSVQDQLNQLTQQRAALKDLGQQIGSLLEKVSDQDWISYYNRWMISGEAAAGQWPVNKYGQK